jgi:hypothetical protein
MYLKHKCDRLRVASPGVKPLLVSILALGSMTPFINPKIPGFVI